MITFIIYLMNNIREWHVCTWCSNPSSVCALNIDLCVINKHSLKYLVVEHSSVRLKCKYTYRSMSKLQYKYCNLELLKLQVRKHHSNILNLSVSVSVSQVALTLNFHLASFIKTSRPRFSFTKCYMYSKVCQFTYQFNVLETALFEKQNALSFFSINTLFLHWPNLFLVHNNPALNDPHI